MAAIEPSSVAPESEEGSDERGSPLRLLAVVAVALVVALVGLSGWATRQVRSAQGTLGDEIAAFQAFDGMPSIRSGPCPVASIEVPGQDQDLLPSVVAELEAAGFERRDRHTHVRERSDDLDADLVEVRVTDAGLEIEASVFDHDLALCD